MGILCVSLYLYVFLVLFLLFFWESCVCKGVCLYIYVFLVLFLLLFVLPYLSLFLLFYYHSLDAYVFSHKRKKLWISDGTRGGDLREVERMETIIRIYHMKKEPLFLIKENRKKCGNTYLQDQSHPCAPLGRLKSNESNVKAQLTRLPHVWSHCWEHRKLASSSLSFPRQNCSGDSFNMMLLMSRLDHRAIASYHSPGSAKSTWKHKLKDVLIKTSLKMISSICLLLLCFILF